MDLAQVAKQQTLDAGDPAGLHVVVEARVDLHHGAGDRLGPDVLAREPGMVLGEDVEGRVGELGIGLRPGDRLELLAALVVGHPLGLELGAHPPALEALLGVEDRTRVFEGRLDRGEQIERVVGVVRVESGHGVEEVEGEGLVE